MSSLGAGAMWSLLLLDGNVSVDIIKGQGHRLRKIWLAFSSKFFIEFFLCFFLCFLFCFAYVSKSLQLKLFICA